MKDSVAFIDVRRVSVDYALPTGVLQRLGGHKAPLISALQDISFKLPLGSWVTLFGPAASGKSTLLRVLSGGQTVTAGTIRINGQDPSQTHAHVAGYISSSLAALPADTVSDILQTFAKTHAVSNIENRLAEVGQTFALEALLLRPGSSLSTTEHLRVQLAKAALTDVPLLLLDDCVDHLGVDFLKKLLTTLFAGRTGIIATRLARTAEELALPILLLHKSRLAHQGTAEDIAYAASVPRIVDVWLEGVRYDLLRQLRKHPGVTEVRLVPSDQYAGQRLRVWLLSSHYLPSLYDVVSQASLIKIEELPPSLTDILQRL